MHRQKDNRRRGVVNTLRIAGNSADMTPTSCHAVRTTRKYQRRAQEIRSTRRRGRVFMSTESRAKWWCPTQKNWSAVDARRISHSVLHTRTRSCLKIAYFALFPHGALKFRAKDVHSCHMTYHQDWRQFSLKSRQKDEKHCKMTSHTLLGTVDGSCWQLQSATVELKKKRRLHLRRICLDL